MVVRRIVRRSSRQPKEDTERRVESVNLYLVVVSVGVVSVGDVLFSLCLCEREVDF